ncbi:hypothetical protein OEIGOIKO_03873 [Streptomyces chrestomyceticus JCM 4735]|uniref:Uncharacterized protein n=1 Tax=Streptomyces chrestomyceticus JCM 4735 TaxID=1306181 RepID=A0A7U9KWK2_9ACTN|nr:hypothetical protein [Streptomyces chrestomyceticus]GCD36118.1 hypothetical protein OEIGOIKO_03873 [Streptomyces chrestomyceticus JCM 4735]
MSGAHAEKGSRMARALRASGLPRRWAARYPALAGPRASARAAAHVSGTLERLPRSYRFGAEIALRIAGLALRGAGPAPAGSSAPAGHDRLARIPGFGRFLDLVDALALYGALDGERDT